MKYNLMRKNKNKMSSGKHRKASHWVLYSLGVAAVFGIAYALILSAMAVDSAAGKASAPEMLEMDGSYKVVIDGFVTTIHVEDADDLRLADKWNEEQLLFTTVDEPTIPSPEENDVENNGEENSEVKFDVTEVTEGEQYEAFKAQITGDAGELMPMQVMQVTASKDGVPIDMAGCNITMDVMPTEELIDKASKKLGVSVKVLTSDGNVTEETYTNAQIGSGELAPIAATFTVPEDGTVMYAVSSRAITSRTIEENEAWSDVLVVKTGENVVIDLMGHTVTRNIPHVHTTSCYTTITCGKVAHEHNWETCEEWNWEATPPGEGWKPGSNGGYWRYKCGLEPHTHTLECYEGNPVCGQQGHTHNDDCYDSDGETFKCNVAIFVEEGGNLTIQDSVGGGSITANGLPSLITLNNGNLTIKGGRLENGNGERVITALGNANVDMEGGTVTGATKGVWGGAGIYAVNGTVAMSSGIIEQNFASKGGGIYMAGNGTVAISGNARIERNKATVEQGGGIYVAGNGTVKISGNAKIKDNVANEHGGGIYMHENDGTVDISGGEISNNSAIGTEWSSGGGVYVKKGVVTISGEAIIQNNTVNKSGGGICVNVGTVKMSDGTISANSATVDGGGIYVAEGIFEMSNGVIGKGDIPEESNGKVCVEGNIAGQSGGGVWAKKMVMSGGMIAGNRATRGGGGVYTHSLEMIDGTISKNHVAGGATDLGGGGIFIASKIEKIGTFHDDTENDVDYNMSISGGTISGNTSSHTGGGIFVDTGAVAYITGAGGRQVHIEGNTAYDLISGHGYAGGGIFVEHPNNADAETAKDGGQLYIYNAVITGNSAKYGGGVAGCGSSNVTVCSVNGVAVYGNTVSGTEAEDVRYPVSGDLYVDGKGTVDGIMMGGVEVKWSGKRKLAPGAEVESDKITDIVVVGEWQREFEYGFYLHATELSDTDKVTINSYANVFIQGNESGSGGGGVGGNGFMKLGLRPSDSEKYDLKLKKIVNGVKNNDEPEKFEFTIMLTNANNELIESSIPYKKGKESEESGTQESESESVLKENGLHVFELESNEYIRLTDLPSGTRYTITEVLIDGYEPSFEVIKGDVTNDNTVNNVVIGWIAQDNSIVFTNTALYALPETGGETTAMYYLLGCALLVTAMAGGWMYKRRSNSVSSGQ